MQILCVHDYWDIHKWEIYERDQWWFLVNSFTQESIKDSDAYRIYPEYFIDILPEIDTGKSELEIKVSALCRRHQKLLKDKWALEKEIDTVVEMIYKLEELGADHL